jgi:hypothetical protein
MFFLITSIEIRKIDSLPINEDVMKNQDFLNWLYSLEVNCENEVDGDYYAEINDEIMLADFLSEYNVVI